MPGDHTVSAGPAPFTNGSAVLRRVGRDRLVVDAQVGLGERVHREAPRHGLRPRRRGGRPAAGRSAPERGPSASAVESPGGTSSPSRSAIATLRYPGRSLATTGVRAAMASSSTTPNDSPRSDGAQNTSAPCIRAAFSASVTRPSHSIRTSPANRALSVAVSGPSPATHKRTSGGSCAIDSSRTSSPLRGSCRPMKKTVGPSARRRRRLLVEVGLDPVVQEAVLATERLVRELACVL